MTLLAAIVVVRSSWTSSLPSSTTGTTSLRQLATLPTAVCLTELRRDRAAHTTTQGWQCNATTRSGFCGCIGPTTRTKVAGATRPKTASRITAASSSTRSTSSLPGIHSRSTARSGLRGTTSSASEPRTLRKSPKNLISTTPPADGSSSMRRHLTRPCVKWFASRRTLVK